MPRYTLLLAGFLLLTSSATAQTAQPARLNVSVQGGVIRNFQYVEYHGLPRYAFYPEVQIASRPFSITRGLSLQGGLHWGYWDDGVRVDKILHNKSCSTIYSHSSHIAGVRFYVVPTKIPLVSLSLFGGLSWHFISGDYVAVPPSPKCLLIDQLPPYWGENYPNRLKALEVGLRVAVPLGNRLAVTTEVKKYVHVPAEERNPHTRNRFAYKLGLSFGLF